MNAGDYAVIVTVKLFSTAGHPSTCIRNVMAQVPASATDDGATVIVVSSSLSLDTIDIQLYDSSKGNTVVTKLVRLLCDEKVNVAGDSPTLTSKSGI